RDRHGGQRAREQVAGGLDRRRERAAHAPPAEVARRVRGRARPAGEAVEGAREVAEWARAARSRGESGRGDRLTLEAGDVHEREDRARHVARRALAARWVHEWRGLPVGDARAARELAYRDARLRSDPARDDAFRLQAGVEPTADLVDAAGPLARARDRDGGVGEAVARELRAHVVAHARHVFGSKEIGPVQDDELATDA